LLLLVGFGPPWLQLKAGVDRQVNDEMYAIQEQLLASARKRAETGPQPATVESLSARLDDALALLRSAHLDRMRNELGRAEGRAILLRLLAPASTIAWKFLRPFLMPG
jgi:hypothetical protein